MLTLGIETSCDETALAVTSDNKILANMVSSSVHLHKRFGGVIPEIASRYHVEYINYVLVEALREAGVTLDDIELLAVTYGPGLVGSLLVGISLAKAIGWSRNIPLLGVNHVIGHLYAVLMQEEGIKFPFVGLVVSGGHTALIFMEDVDKCELLGQTTDDAVGESFDKVAKILGLGYPGGPIVERRALKGDPYKIKFPKVRLAGNPFNFSFSGIKTAVLYYVKSRTAKRIEGKRGVIFDTRKNNIRLGKDEINDICASFQETVFEVLAEKALHACRLKKSTRLVVGGGVIANSRLKERLKEMADDDGLEVFFPPLALCMDNGVMIGGLGEALYKKGKTSGLSLTAVSELEVEGRRIKC